MTTQILALIVVVLAVAMIVIIIGKLRLRGDLQRLQERVVAFAPDQEEKDGE